MAGNLRWMQLLDEEDLAFLKRFVLASGSLKELAEAYGISYPTVRLRLDRLIAKIQVYDSQRKMGEFERVTRGLMADGRLDPATLKILLSVHKKELEYNHEQARAGGGVDSGK
ncbi:MAG: DUF2089 domain-containing protein [Gemmataceae bacterium]|nr:DUF2089 domain-containing protein [Gemmataceae bacterium]